MKVAAAQIACAAGDLEQNLRKIATFAERARDAGAELVVFPEMADTGYALDAIRASARPWNEGTVPALQEMARRFSIAILCGISEREDDTIYNAQILLDPAGNIIGRYRKTHLFRAGNFDESECFTPGSEIATCDLGGFRLGLSICYDLRFPEIYRAQAAGQQANLFIVSAGWPFPRAEHLRLLAQARAIENQSYLLLANRVGTDAGVTFCGGTAIIDPYGTVLAAASPDREELVLAGLLQETLTTVRERMSVFAHRRLDLYGKL